MNKAELIERLRAQQGVLKARGIEHLAIFGSRARGDYRPDSDLDVLLDLAPSDKFSLLDLIGIEHLIADATGIQASAQLRRSVQGEFAKSIADDVAQVF
jgi:predicted nucleotidyltransferase